MCIAHRCMKAKPNRIELCMLSSARLAIDVYMKTILQRNQTHKQHNTHKEIEKQDSHGHIFIMCSCHVYVVLLVCSFVACNFCSGRC